MAQRRMLSKSISVSVQVNSLDDRAALLFTWMIPHADDWGRMNANPQVVRALVVPMREEFSVEVVHEALQKMGEADLVCFYHHDGSDYLYFPKWDAHQGALAKSRRTASKLPEPPGTSLHYNEVQCNSTLTQPNSTQPNLTQPNSTSPARPRATNRQLLEDLMPGNIGPKELSWLEKAEEEYGDGEVREVLIMADGENLDRPIAWCKRVLANRRKENSEEGGIHWKDIDWNDRELFEAGIPVEKYKGKRLIGAPEGVHT